MGLGKLVKDIGHIATKAKDVAVATVSGAATGFVTGGVVGAASGGVVAGTIQTVKSSETSKRKSTSKILSNAAGQGAIAGAASFLVPALAPKAGALVSTLGKSGLAGLLAKKATSIDLSGLADKAGDLNISGLTAAADKAPPEVKTAVQSGVDRLRSRFGLSGPAAAVAAPDAPAGASFFQDARTVGLLVAVGLLGLLFLKQKKA